MMKRLYCLMLTLVFIIIFFASYGYAASLLPLEIGASYTYDVTDSSGNTWEMDTIVSGVAKVKVNWKKYFLGDLVGTDRDGGYQTILLRSTSNGVYQYAGFNNEFLRFQKAEVGTSWIYDKCGDTIERKIEAIETVTVPAGTFKRCMKTCGYNISSTPPILYECEWLKPGFGVVKEIDYYGVENPPIVKELKSWTK